MTPASSICLSQACIEAVQWWLQEARWQSGVPLKIPPPPSPPTIPPPPVLVVVYWRFPVGLGGPFTRSDSLGDLVTGGDPRAHQHAGNASSRTGSSYFPASVVGAESDPDKRQRGGCHLSPAFGLHGVSEVVSDGVWHHPVDRAAFCSVGDEVHPGEEEHSGWSTEWFLFPRMLEEICNLFGRPHLDLFNTHADTKLPIYESPIPDPVAWEQDALHQPWDNFFAFAFPPFTLLRQVLSLVLVFKGLSEVLVAPLWPQKELVHWLSISSCSGTPRNSMSL